MSGKKHPDKLVCVMHKKTKHIERIPHGEARILVVDQQTHNYCSKKEWKKQQKRAA